MTKKSCIEQALKDGFTHYGDGISRDLDKLTLTLGEKDLRDLYCYSGHCIRKNANECQKTGDWSEMQLFRVHGEKDVEEVHYKMRADWENLEFDVIPL